MNEDFPSKFIEVLGAPGKFVRKANAKVKLPDGKTGEMDAPYVADPDGKTIFERSLILLEHQRFLVSGPKGLMISNYIIQGVADEKLPYYVAIASHLYFKKHLQEFDRNGSFIIRLKFIDLGERNNWERLYNLRNKLKFKKNLSVKDGLNLGIVAVFAPEDCNKERTREALNYLLKYEITSKRLELVLYCVFYAMIDAYFDDEEEYKKVSEETLEKSNMQIRQQNRMKDLETERDEAYAKIDKAYDLIGLFSKLVDVEDENVKKKLNPYKNILKNFNILL